MLTFNGIAEGKETILGQYVKISDEPIDLDTVSAVVYSRMIIDGEPEIVATFTKDMWSTQELIPGVFAIIVDGEGLVFRAVNDITDDYMHLSKGVYVYCYQSQYVSLVSYTVEANVENKTFTFNGDATGMETIMDDMYVKISDTYVDPRSIISATGVAGGGIEVLTVPATAFLPSLIDANGDGSVFLLMYNGMSMIVLVSTKVDDGSGIVLNPGVYVINVPGEMYISEIQYYVELPPEYDWFRHLFLNEAKASIDARINTEAEELRKELDAAEEEFRKELETAEEEFKKELETANDTIAELEDWKSTNAFAFEFWKIKQSRAILAYLFDSCFTLTSIPLFDTRSATDMSDMFHGCSALTSVPLFNTSNVTTMNRMFRSCAALTSIPLFDTSKVTTMTGMLQLCANLTSVPPLDTRKVTTMTNMFAGCTNLTDCYLRNIKTNLTVGSGTSCGHLLTLDSLKHLIYELRDTGSQKTLTVGSANLEKLANIYVKLVDITDEMRAEDDLIDEKLPYVVCESTDEGAMLITNYVAEKNWTLK